MKQVKKLNSLSVAGLYVGAIMGAGFASGRETWQFFGVFGKQGVWGIAIFAVLFLLIGHFIRYIAIKLNTNDMGKIIVPGNNQKLESFVGYFMAVILANVLVIMTAAGSALLNQQFSLPYWVGGIVIMVLVVLTVLGDFERLSGVFRYIMPVLCVSMVVTCIIVLIVNPADEVTEEVINPSPVAPNWFISALSYTAYNVLALISIVATASLNSKTEKTAIIGTSIGGLFLGILAILILFTVQCNMSFSQESDMPVLGYADRVSASLGLAYTAILFCTIYSAAAGNFYGFTTKIKEGPNKKKIIVAAALFAYLIGLIGFKNIVKYISPIMGYMGLIIIIMLVCNFIFTWKKEHKKMDKISLDKILVRVTGGPGGEAVLIKGKDKTALHDCGMACFNEELIKNIENELLDKPLDYVILSHSHYDHMGALPYIIKRWPGVTVCGSKKTFEVFNRHGAVDMIVSMGKSAAEFYQRDTDQITAEGIRVDKVLENGDIIDLGDEKILCFETRGHTDCSMSYFMQPYGILFTSESTGVLEKDGNSIHTSVLKSFDESIESAEFLKLLPYKHLLLPHYGILPEEYNDKYFDMYIEAAEKEKQLIEGLIKDGFTVEQIFEKHKDVYWSEEKAVNHPFRAYKMNTEIIIKRMIKETENELS